MLKKIKKILLDSGIFKANYIYIYSDFRTFFKLLKSNPEKEVKNFLNLFKNKGITCITPAFSYTTKGKFDVNITKSKVGFLSNFIIKNEKFERSFHPMFSFVAIGRNRKLLKKLGKSAFGKNSLHSKLLNKNCCFLNFNRTLIKGNTLMHHIEQKNKAKYRFEKVFKTKVYKNKIFMGDNYKAFVRKNINLNYSLGTFDKAYKKLKNKKYFFKKKIKNLEILTYPYDDFYYDLDKLFKKNSNIFIKTQ